MTKISIPTHLRLTIAFAVFVVTVRLSLVTPVLWTALSIAREPDVLLYIVLLTAFALLPLVPCTILVWGAVLGLRRSVRGRRVVRIGYLVGIADAVLWAVVGGVVLPYAFSLINSMAICCALP